MNMQDAEAWIKIVVHKLNSLFSQGVVRTTIEWEDMRGLVTQAPQFVTFQWFWDGDNNHDRSASLRVSWEELTNFETDMQLVGHLHSVLCGYSKSK